jgi:uncharacterized protein (TIGR02757 family)
LKALLPLHDFLDHKLLTHKNKEFIKDDPLSIPYLFTKPEDREIAGFFAAIFAWGNRKTIISKSTELLARMDMCPHAFCLRASPAELKKLLDFKHRTFNTDDLLYFVEFFRNHYSTHQSLESAFTIGLDPTDITIEKGLIHFQDYFFEQPHLPRTRKHITSPALGSACKRLNMYLRWMVRNDDIDLGLWKNIKPSQLICPLDLHVSRVAKKFGLISRPNADWYSALELTANLRKFDPEDPVKYDFALFALGAVEKY